MNELIETGNNLPVSGEVFAKAESFQDLFNIGKMFASSSLVPQAYQGKAMDCAIAIDMANRMGLSPMMVMQNLYVVKGKPSWSGQACMGMIKANAGFKEAKPIYFGEKGTEDRGCYIKAVTKEGEFIEGPDVTLKMARLEGWTSNKKWQTMPELMLAYRAAAFFARIHVPNLLMGCLVEGEAEDISPEKPKAVDPFEAKEGVENATDK